MTSIPPLTVSSMPHNSLVQPLKKTGQTEEQMRKTSEDFEAMALGEMLEPIFETVDTSSGPFGGGEAEGQLRSLQVMELGKQIARNGGVGIARQVYESMQKMQSQANSQSKRVL